VRFEGNVVMNLTIWESQASPSMHPPRLRSRPARQNALLGASPPTRMTFMMMFLPRSTDSADRDGICTAAFALAVIAAGDAGAQSAVAGRAQCHAGFFAKIATSRSRSRPPRSRCRQEKGSDIRGN